MSILIKGLEMPEDGALLCIKIYPSGVVRTCFSPHLPPDSKIATAIPISDHGDLIDRDALMPKGEEKGLRLMAIGIENIVNAPTVIPAERSEE